MSVRARRASVRAPERVIVHAGAEGGRRGHAQATGIARALASVARSWGRDVIAFALPQRCPACGAPTDGGALLCAPCREAIPRIAFSLCTRCLALERDPVGCVLHPHHRAWAAWVYDERAALIVQAFKYRERVGLARGLALEIARALPAHPRPDLIVEVPLHPARRRERGYNQAEALAEALADEIGVPRVAGVLARVRATRPQARLGPAARRHNLAGAFRVQRPEWVRARRVLVVDDVMTTGATLAACLDALADVGAWGLAAAVAWAQ